MTDVNATIENEIKSQDVVVFMKGTDAVTRSCRISEPVTASLRA